VKFASDRRGEANHLMEWLGKCLGLDCEFMAQQNLTNSAVNDSSLGFEIRYRDNRHITWASQAESNTTQFEHSLLGSVKSFPIRIKSLLPEQELAEAFYF
jgi:hypothetical protein